MHEKALMGRHGSLQLPVIDVVCQRLSTISGIVRDLHFKRSLQVVAWQCWPSRVIRFNFFCLLNTLKIGLTIQEALPCRFATATENKQ